MSWFRHSGISDDVVFRASAAMMVFEAESFQHLAHLFERGIIFLDTAIAEVHLMDNPRNRYVLAILRAFRFMK